jgi:ABC-type transport system involved in multi-copper enzyme maturation permease subunit
VTPLPVVPKVAIGLFGRLLVAFNLADHLGSLKPNVAKPSLSPRIWSGNGTTSRIVACFVAMGKSSVNSIRQIFRTISTKWNMSRPMRRQDRQSMSRTFPTLLEVAPLRAVLLREFRDALINRYFQVFSVLSLLGGAAAFVLSEDTHSIAFLILQISLYFVSLFALLAGASSAQAERDEWQLLFAQPVPRAAYVLGKFIAYLSIFGAVLLLLFLPGFTAGSGGQRIAMLYVQTLLLAAAFLALGLAAGFLAHDRAQALIAGVSAWLLLLFGIDLIALFAARWELIQKFPNLWVSLLMLNRLDSFRIEALFALEQIPAEAANKTPLASWWIAHADLWFSVIAICWCAAFVSLAGWRLNRWEE